LSIKKPEMLKYKLYESASVFLGMALTFSHTTEKLLQKYITALVIWWTAM
jgi:hypothetical protein